MVRGLYSAASGALVAQSMADNVANNLANVNTSGFKSTLMQIEAAPSLDIYRVQTDPGRVPGAHLNGRPIADRVGLLGTGALVHDTPNSFEQGALQSTGNPYDLAISGNGFFAIQTPAGVRYTRDGQFLLDNQNNLVTQDGNYVLGTRGVPINVQGTGPVKIGTDGTVTQNGQTVDQVQVVGFNNVLALRPQGDNLFQNTGNAAPVATNAGVQQGFLEKSNANVVKQMVDLITAERWFDANQKSMQTQDDATGLAISDLARTAK